VGDVCVGPNGKLQMSGEQFIDGTVRLDVGAQISQSGSTTVGGISADDNLAAEIAAALGLAADAAQKACTLNLGLVKEDLTITGNGGFNVVCLEGIELSGGKQITLSGSAEDTFVLNITGKKFKLSGGSDIRTTGLLEPQRVLYNVIGVGEDVALSGGGGGATCCEAIVDGTILAPERKVKLSPGLVNGAVISAKNITLSSGGAARSNPLQCLQ
jgi:choice-of-anchor A domain-containing protein